MPDIPLQKGYCPPPIEGGSEPPVAKSYPEPPYKICIGDIVNSLADIEEWIKGVRRTLEKFPPDHCVIIGKKNSGAKP